MPHFEIIYGRYTMPFTFTCRNCGIRRLTNRDEGARADLNGPPFSAYCCGACVAILSTTAKAPEDSKGASQ